MGRLLAISYSHKQYYLKPGDTFMSGCCISLSCLALSCFGCFLYFYIAYIFNQNEYPFYNVYILCKHCVTQLQPVLLMVWSMHRIGFSLATPNTAREDKARQCVTLHQSGKTRWVSPNFEKYCLVIGVLYATLCYNITCYNGTDYTLAV